MLSHEQRRLLAICDRLKNSRNPLEARSIFQGVHHPLGYPVLLDTKLLFEHKHIVGPPGTGKTTLGLASDVLQLIHRNDGPVVIFDCKGDLGFFHNVYAASLRAGRTFKWFTNKPFCSTYIFNPWDKRFLKSLTLPETIGYFMQSFNLHHGQGYGRSFFQMSSRHFIREGILDTIPQDNAPNARSRSSCGSQPPQPPIQSFSDFHEVLNSLAMDKEERQGIQHLMFIVESLMDFDQVNLSPRHNPHDPKLANAIFMPEVIRENQVVYFYLVGAMDVAAVAEIAKLALYSLLMAAIAYKDEFGYPPKVYTAWDEAQLMIAGNIENVLAQSRSHGVACILAHQSMSQLNPPGQDDLRELVWTCTATKDIYGVRDPWLMQHISNTSGTTRYFRQKYRVAADNVLAGEVGVPYAYPNRNGRIEVSIDEFTGPRITQQDILDVSQHPNLSLMWIDRIQGLSRFQGWFPVRKSWPISKCEHEQYSRAPWPAVTEATDMMQTFWPDSTDETIVPQHHPAIAPGQREIEVSASLQSLQQILTQK